MPKLPTKVKPIDRAAQAEAERAITSGGKSVRKRARGQDRSKYGQRVTKDVAQIFRMILRDPQNPNAANELTKSAFPARAITDPRGAKRDMRRVLEGLLRLHVGMKTKQDATTKAKVRAAPRVSEPEFSQSEFGGKTFTPAAKQAAFSSKFPITGRRWPGGTEKAQERALKRPSGEAEPAGGLGKLQALFGRMGLKEGSQRRKKAGSYFEEDSGIPLSMRTGAKDQATIARRSVAETFRDAVSEDALKEPLHPKALIARLTKQMVSTFQNRGVRKLAHRVGPLSGYLNDYTDQLQRKLVGSAKQQKSKSSGLFDEDNFYQILENAMGSDTAERATQASPDKIAIALADLPPKTLTRLKAVLAQMKAAEREARTVEGMASIPGSLGTKARQADEFVPPTPEEIAERRAAQFNVPAGARMSPLSDVLNRRQRGKEGGADVRIDEEAKGLPQFPLESGEFPRTGMVGKTAVLLKALAGKKGRGQVITEDIKGKQKTYPTAKVKIPRPAAGVQAAREQQAPADQEYQKLSRSRSSLAKLLQSKGVPMTDAQRQKGAALLNLVDQRLGQLNG